MAEGIADFHLIASVGSSLIEAQFRLLGLANARFGWHTSFFVGGTIHLAE